MGERMLGLLEVALVLLLAVGVGLIVADLTALLAGVGAGCVTAAAGWLVIVVAAQIPGRPNPEMARDS